MQKMNLTKMHEIIFKTGICFSRNLSCSHTQPVTYAPRHHDRTGCVHLAHTLHLIIITQSFLFLFRSARPSLSKIQQRH